MSKRCRNEVPQHWNNNQVCVVTAQFTGLEAQIYDIIQICIVPLDGFYEIDSTKQMFIASMQTRHNMIERKYVKYKYNKCIEIMQSGVDPYFTADELEKWFEKIRVVDNRQIMPLAYNWPLVASHLVDWLGFQTFNYIFSHEYRDIMPATIFCNDRAYWQMEDYPFPKTILTYMANVTKEDYSLRYDIMQQAIAISKIYKKMLIHYIGR